MKKVFAVVLSILLLLPSLVMAKENTEVNVYVRGEWIEHGEKSPILIQEERICLPLRLMAEKLGNDVKWNQTDKSVTLVSDGKEVVMKVGAKDYTVNGKNLTMDVAPFVQGEKTYLPMRFIGEALGEKVEWDQKNHIALFGGLPAHKDVKGEKIDIAPGLNFTIPEKVKDQYLYKKTEQGYFLYDKKSYDANPRDGWLGSFDVVPVPTFDVPHIVIRKMGDKYLVFHKVSDVQYNIEDEALTKSYQEALERLPEVLSTVEWAK